MKNSKGILPQENLFRAVHSVTLPTYELQAVRAAKADDGDGRTLELQWSVFDRWTEINSYFEGRFLERIAPGAFTKTIQENRANMRILLEHGYDPQLGDKPIASIDRLEENEVGGYAEGRLFDGLDPLVVEGLRAGVYGSSFRFRVMRDEYMEEPEESDYNPKGIPERTIKEAQVMEFGPVTWGAYSEASAGVRSITDEMVFGTLRRMPRERLTQIVEFWRSFDKTFALDATDAPSEEEPERRDDAPEGDEPESREQETTETTEAPPAEGTPTVERDYLHGTHVVPPWHLS